MRPNGYELAIELIACRFIQPESYIRYALQRECERGEKEIRYFDLVNELDNLTLLGLQSLQDIISSKIQELEEAEREEEEREGS